MTETTLPPPIPAFVLVRPQMGENIGAAARAMWNFGLDHMRLVAPRDGWPNPAAVAMASGAGRLLDEASLCPDLPSALADCDYVFATTARGRDLTKPVFSPQAAMAEAATRIAAGQRVAVLFGPERAGLENDDIARANAIISVPVNPTFASLNLAQCVHFEDRLEEAGFFFPGHKAASMKLNLRNMWSRMPLTRADVQMFHGMMRQMVRWKERD